MSHNRSSSKAEKGMSTMRLLSPENGTNAYRDELDDTAEPDTPFRQRSRQTWLGRTPRPSVLLLWALVIGVAYYFGKYEAGASPYGSTSSGITAFDKTNIGTVSGPRDTFYFSNGTLFERPESLRVVGVIFFGRRQFVDILDCYLRRNLKINGGMLDEVHFLMHTDDDVDKNWLRKMITNHKMQEHYKLKAEDTSGNWNRWATFDKLYRDFMTEPETIYVKIDDDVVYVDDYAIPELVKTVLEHPEAHSIMSNNINNKWNYWYHHRTGAIWPYLAEQSQSSRWPIDSWKPSQLPHYGGNVPRKMFNFTGNNYPVPSRGHRWLPLRETKSHAESVQHTPWGPWLPNPMFHERRHAAGWAVTAQAHYSLFENLERGLLHKYYFGNGVDRTWNLWYSRYNINFFAIKGSNLLKEPFWDSYEEVDKGDEVLLTTTIPAKLDMPVLIATRSIVSHFSFRGDREKVLQSDVLDRYLALANDMYCTADNQKRRFGPRLGPHHIAADKPKPKPKTGASSDDDADHEGEFNEIVDDGPSDKWNPTNEEFDDDESRPSPGPVAENPPPGAAPPPVVAVPPANPAPPPAVAAPPSNAAPDGTVPITQDNGAPASAPIGAPVDNLADADVENIPGLPDGAANPGTLQSAPDAQPVGAPEPVAGTPAR